MDRLSGSVNIVNQYDSGTGKPRFRSRSERPWESPKAFGATEACLGASVPHANERVVNGSVRVSPDAFGEESGLVEPPLAQSSPMKGNGDQGVGAP